MFKIQTFNKIAAKGLDLLSRDNYEIASEFTDPDAIILRSAKLHDMEFSDQLKGIARAGAGVNNIPVDRCTEKGIVVFNTPGANANAVKELVLAGMLLSARGISQGINWVQSVKDKADEVPKIVEKEKSNFKGTEILGKTLGLIGLGAVGVAVANAAASLGMKVIGFDPFISVKSAWGLSRNVKNEASLDNLLAASDYISIHPPLNDQTRGMINAERFKAMKPGIKIMNFARGGLVNNTDLLEAIKEGIVDSYVTDFPEAELLGNDKVIPIPHLGASTKEAEENCAVMAAEQIKDFLECGNIRNAVNFPDCVMEASEGHRIVIINKNIPNMVGQITTVLAKHNINISNMLNRHKGDYAYNIIDVEDNLNEEVISGLKEIQGVITVRHITMA